MKAITFRNFTTEDFSHTWDSVPYTFKGKSKLFPHGQEMTMEDWKAEHFAKHLIDRELNKKGFLTNDQNEIKKLKEKCLIDPEAVVSESDIINKNELAKTKKTKVSEDVEFPDLSDK